MSENRNNSEFSSPPKVLIFGGTGAIGKEICSHYKVRGWDVTVTSRKPFKADDHVFWDVLTPNPSNNEQLTKALKARGQFNAVCWAQGKNCSDSIYDFDLNEHMDLYNANVTYILASLSFLGPRLTGIVATTLSAEASKNLIFKVSIKVFLEVLFI